MAWVLNPPPLDFETNTLLTIPVYHFHGGVKNLLLKEGCEGISMHRQQLGISRSSEAVQEK